MMDTDNHDGYPQSELRDMKEQFEKASMMNDQLDKEKQVYLYRIEDLNDKLEELQENFHKLSKDHKELNTSHNLLSRDHLDLKNDLKFKDDMIIKLEKLIADHGLVLVNFDDANIINGDLQNINASASASGPSTLRSSVSSSLTSATETRSSSVFSSATLNTNRPLLNGCNDNNATDGTNSQINGADGDTSSSVSSSATETGAVTTGPNGSLAGVINNNSINNRSRSASVSVGPHPLFSGPILMPRDLIQLIESFEGLNLEEKLKCMAEEREDLIHEIQRLRMEIDDYKMKIDRLSLASDVNNVKNSSSSHTSNNANISNGSNLSLDDPNCKYINDCIIMMSNDNLNNCR